MKSSDAEVVRDKCAEEKCGRHGEEAAGETSIMGSFIIRALHESDEVKEGAVGGA